MQMDTAYIIQDGGEGRLDFLDADGNFVIGFTGLTPSEMRLRLDALPPERLVSIDPPALGLTRDQRMSTKSVMAMLDNLFDS